MLTLKYRPQRISDLIGQDDVKLALEKAFSNGKIANAYLLTGPRGAGKTSTARIIAKSLNCKNKKPEEKATLNPCGKCSSCVNITNSNDLDVIEIDAASHGGVDDARDLVVKATLSTINSDYKIYIIDEVHMVSKEGFNALLKLFEEPPENVVFILATTESHKVLATISSRCQQFRFKPISPKDCFKRLQEICKIENINIENNALDLISEESEGALRDALSILEQVSVFNERDKVISREIVEKTLGKVSEKEIISLAYSLLNKEADEILKKIEGIFIKSPDPLILNNELFQILIKILEELCLDEGLETLKDCINLIKEKAISKAELVFIAEEISKYEALLKQSSQAHKLFKALCLKLSFREDFIEIKDLKERIKRLENSQGISAVSNQVNIPKIQKTSHNTAPSLKPVVKEAQSTLEIDDGKAKNEKAEISPPEDSNKDIEAKQPEATETPSETFTQHLSPASKGLLISSKASLISCDGEKALFQIPEKFKFLKAKLEAKAEEIIQALKASGSPNLKSIQIELASGDLNEANQGISQSIKKLPANIDEAPKISNETKPKLNESLGLDSSISETPHSLVNLRLNERAAINAGEADTCCDREAYLDEVLQAGISIFGGTEIRE